MQYDAGNLNDAAQGAAVNLSDAAQDTDARYDAVNFNDAAQDAAVQHDAMDISEAAQEAAVHFTRLQHKMRLCSMMPGILTMLLKLRL